MWPFKSKKIETLQLPPLPSKFDNDVSSLPELPEEIPEEIPPLEELNANKALVQQTSPDVGAEFPEIPAMPENVVKKERFAIPSKDKFIMMDRYKELLTQLVSTNEEFHSIDSEFSRVIKLKEEKDSKIDALQNSLEETGKKMMFMENTLFGG